jgi:micrococcal nuclease
MPRNLARAIPFLLAIAVWLSYGALAEKWPAIDIANGLGSNLIFGQGNEQASGFVKNASAGHWRAIDGDTFVGPDKQTIRVMGVDTPELHPCRCAYECEQGERAKRRVQALLDGGSVSVQSSGLDKYGRTLAHVTIDGRDLSSILIREGLGRPYGGERRQPWCG